MSDWITITEARVITGLTDAQVRDLAVNGELAAKVQRAPGRKNAQWWVDRADAEALKRRRMNQPTRSTT